ncbi:uncharacterized protein LOC127625260 isoform X2 [Xyrauchen texanus]|uniref:uncharacterized protein LOC127625260 isoform X2 n=1 Tax=Xyrauchen texanus TaxID=154827 RepID=UPI0022429F5B|nr:uncharacterized protein LOC127625260 isoform X2 [Xyrauchen texanus]
MMMMCSVKIKVKQEEIKEITTEEQWIDEDDEQQMLETSVKMCSVKLVDCRNLMKMRREPTTEEQQRYEDNDDGISSELMKGRTERRELNKVEEKLQDQEHHDLKTENNFSPNMNPRRSAKNPNSYTQCGKSFITFTFTFMHLADTFIQSDLQCTYYRDNPPQGNLELSALLKDPTVASWWCWGLNPRPSGQ